MEEVGIKRTSGQAAVLMDRCMEYMSKSECHKYELYMASEGIEYTKAEVRYRSPGSTIFYRSRPCAKEKTSKY